MSSKAKEYPYIWAYGKYMHSKDYYIRDQLKQAKADNAPEDAVFKSSDNDNTWVTLDDINKGMADELKFLARRHDTH